MKNVVIEIPLFKALEQIPSYAKFMKKMCTPTRRGKNNKGKENGKVPTVHKVGVLPNFPIKKTDPSAPIVSCLIGEHMYKNVLLDDGASVNLFPTLIVEKFNLGQVRPTSTTFEFADRSFKQPKGVLEDVIMIVQGH